MKRSIRSFVILVICALLTASAFAQGTAFTYQGRLLDGGKPANGNYDLTFRLFDAGTNGNLISGPVTNAATAVSNGLFSVALDFGANFPGADRWLQIGVRTNGGTTFTSLAGRQEVMPTPYATTAAGVAAGAITANMLANGAVTSDKIATGAVKGYQIDDGGSEAYQGFQNAVQSVGGDASLSFANLFLVTATNAVPPAFTLTVNGSAFGTVVGFSGSEGISEPYSYVVQVLSSGAGVNPDAQVGLPGRLTFTRNGRSSSFGGIITAFTLSSSSGTGRLHTLRIESPLAYMALTTDYRIYQNLSAPSVASSVYQDITTNTPTLSLVGSYALHENLIQYAETALNFFSRLLEYEGIFYFFNHGANPPVLILGDGTSAYLSAPNSPFAYFGNTATNIPAGSEYIRTFQKAAHQSTLRSTVNTYNFQTPGLSLTRSSTSAAGVGERYEFGTSVRTAAYDQQVALARQGRHEVQHATMAGSGTTPDLHAGYTFTLSDQTGAGLGGTYLVTSVRHAGFIRVTNGVGTFFYGNQFEVIPASLIYRPAPATPRPQAQPCTAVVTGPAGETIYVDQYGRVKVRFHWDRSGVTNENSSAWLRVTSPMAGSSHGMMFLPRIGDEVLVSFIQGDPDQPVVTGSLYNGVAVPPYALPASKTVSTIRSTSTGGGINEIRLDDAAGNEALTVRAAKDLNLLASHLTAIASPLSINGGTVFTNFLAGQGIVGSSSTYQTNVAITFPKTFNSPPKVVLTLSSDPAWNVNDTFVATVRSVSTSGCVVNVVRVDTAGGWSQLLRVNWIAWE